MAPKVKSSGKGYLWRSLAWAVEPFYFRSRVRALLGLPDTGGVQMNFPQPLPFGGFTYAIPQFSGLVEIPDKSIGAARRSSQTSQTFLPDLAAAPPRTGREFQSLSVTRPVSAVVPSNPALGAPAKESHALARTGSRMPVTAEAQPETSAGQRKTEGTPSTPPAPLPAERRAAILDDLSITGRNQILPALRRDLQRPEALKRGEPVASPRAHTGGGTAGRGEQPSTAAGISSDSATAVQSPSLSIEMPALKDPPASQADQPIVSAPLGVTIPPQSTIMQSRLGPSEANQARKIHPLSVSAFRTQSLVAKSLLHQEEAGMAPARNEPRRASGHRRFAETTQEVPAETPVTRPAPAAPEAPPIVIVNQSSETPAAAFWERRYLSHLHLRIRR